ncbi:MAG: beta strand repeat-containing protein, partial [Dolichospermum sp.]
TTVYTVTGSNAACVSLPKISTITVNAIPNVTLTSSSATICAGQSTTITASGATSYTWLPSGSGTSSVVSPTATTVYTVTGDNVLGCTNTQTISLNVAPLFTITPSSSSNTVCAGVSATLTSSGATSYTWNPGALTGTTVTVTPITTTTYTVNGDNGSGCITSNTLTINVNSAPSVSISATPTVLCAAGSVTLTASGANSYTWSPIISLAPSVVDIPTVTTTYTVNGTDIAGCSSTQTIVINVGSPTITIVATPTLLCEGSAANLAASGASTYTWNPGALTGTNIAVTPTTTTTYTVDGNNGSGCISSQTITISVTPNPTVIATANPTLVCFGSASTLTASGATTYTWMPMSVFGTSVVATPTANTTYTLLGDNGGCVGTTTIAVNMTPLPANVTATANGDITCNTATVGLTGNSTTAGVNYSWSGPSSYTSTTQNPTDVITAGDYTLTVTDALFGCTTTTTTKVLSNTIVAGLTAISSGSLGCNTSVSITATSTSTNTLNYNWSGPSSFTSAIQSPTVNVSGDYTVTVSDIVTGCSGTSTVTVGSSTVVPTFTATVTPATCTGTISNNDGTLILTGFGTSDKYDLTQAATYTGSAMYTNATPIPTTGIITNILNNPIINTPYTLRVFSANGCLKDTTLILIPTNCATVTPNILGMTKAVSTPSYVTNNVYNVTYTIVAINPSIVDLTNFSIVDDLSNTFPLPSSYGIISSPTITSLNSSLTINPLFNGTSQTDMLIPASSTLTAGRKDTIVFTVQINPNGFFGPFYNSAIGSGTDNGGIVLADSSNTGFAWDPDNDGDPTNNDTATVVTLNPNSKIGIAKSGSLSEVLADQTIDVTYIFTIKNLGSDTINFVQVLDSLTIPAPAQFTIKSGPTASGSLTANSNYNGVSDIGLLVASASKLAPGAVETITLVLNV